MLLPFRGARIRASGSRFTGTFEVQRNCAACPDGAGARKEDAVEGEGGDLRAAAESSDERCRSASEEEPFRVEADRDGKRITARFFGELDGRTKNPLYGLVRMVSQDGVAEVIVDLGGLGFI